MRRLFFGLVFLGLLAGNGHSATYVFTNYCASTYEKDHQCPKEACQLQCVDGSQTPECALKCIPRECQTFSVASCPKRFCLVAVDCSQEKSCQSKTPFEQIPECGGLGYSAQDAGCCKGLVKRCGFDYMDGKCNMGGENTPYRFPICIPCGDGVCTNFENHCNCPEDCKKDIIPL